MDFQINWSEPAIENLGEIVRHVARDNPAAALKLGRELIDRIEVAARFPQAGPLFSKSGVFEFRSLTHDNYQLYYRLQPGRTVVDVVAVRHSARQAPQF